MGNRTWRISTRRPANYERREFLRFFRTQGIANISTLWLIQMKELYGKRFVHVARTRVISGRWGV